MSDILNNIDKLIKNYGDKIHNDKQFLLAYWRIIDNVEMDKNSISTKSFLNSATCARKILNAKTMHEIIKGDGE